MIRAYRLLPWLLPRIPSGPRERLVADCEWLVVDCESSGLNPRRDRLLEVGCVAVDGTTIDLAHSFEGVLKQEAVSSIANILVHGISGRRQLNGAAPDAVMQALAAQMSQRIVVGFHAAFDRELCARAMRRFALRRIEGGWLDLSDLAPALYPELAPQCRTLDDWLAAFHIAPVARHRAAGDAFATAQLLIRLITPLARSHHAAELFRLAAAHRELALLHGQPR